MITGIEVVFIHTPDPQLADWYEDVLGLSRIYDDGKWIEFTSLGVTRFALDITAENPSPVEKQVFMVCLRVDDINKEVERLSGKGVQFYPDREHTIFDVGANLVATFQDPHGNWLQLSQCK